VEKMEMRDVKTAEAAGRECVIMVGTTGTGKTTTLNIFTGAEEEEGGTKSAQSTTQVKVTVTDNKHPDGPVWVDNPGWSDGDGKSDKETWRQLLKHLHKDKIQWVKAVIWCVNQDAVADAVLQAQAKLIDTLTVNEDWGKIWPNVVILFKGSIADTAAEDCRAAKAAAQKVYNRAEPRTLGYKLAGANATTGPSQMTKEQRLANRILTKEDAQEKMEEELRDLKSIQVMFENKQCLDCGQTGDWRTMVDMCHKKKVQGHPAGAKQKKMFSKLQVGSAYAAGTVGAAGMVTATVLAGPAAELLLLGTCVGPCVAIGPGVGMTVARKFAKKGDYKWICCKKVVLRTEDGREDAAGNGCEDQCVKCLVKWGTKPGCKPDCKLGCKPGCNPGCIMISPPDIGLGMTLDRIDYEKKEHNLAQI
jgi:energy-coupling factor transporter ATP-binding protein EcfA2